MSYLATDFDERVVELLRHGAVGFMPSDTIYGLSCLALNEDAVKRLHKIKERGEQKPFIILISNIKMLNLLSIKEAKVRLVRNYWPGPLTVICQASNAPPWLSLGGKTLAVRIPADDRLRKLIDKTGPLTSTSANKQGEQPISSIREAQKIFNDELDFYVDKGKIVGEASTIVEVIDGRLKMIRSGAVKIELRSKE